MSDKSAGDTILSALEERIASLSPGDKIPPERQLSRDLGVSRETLRRRLDELTANGYLTRRHGSGTFVSDPKFTDKLWITSFSEDMRLRGLAPSSTLVWSKTTTAGPEIGAALGISPMEPIVALRRVRLANGDPMAIEDLHVSSALVPELDTDVLATESFYEVLHERYGIHVATGRQTIEATVVDERQAQLLDIAPHSPALLVERTTFDAASSPIEHVRSLYRGDRYRFEVTSARLPKPLGT